MGQRGRRISRHIERTSERLFQNAHEIPEEQSNIQQRNLNGRLSHIRDNIQENIHPLSLPERFERSQSLLNHSSLSPQQCRDLSRTIQEIGKWARDINKKNHVSIAERRFLQQLQASLPELCLKLHSHSQKAQDLCFSIVSLANTQTGDRELSLLGASFVRTLDSAPHGLMVRTCWALKKRGVGATHHSYIAKEAGGKILEHPQQSSPKLIAQKVSLIHSCSVFSQHFSLIERLLTSLHDVPLNQIQLKQCFHAAISQDIDREYWLKRFQRISKSPKKIKKNGHPPSEAHMTRILKAYFLWLSRSNKAFRQKIRESEILSNRETFGFECDNFVTITLRDGSPLCFAVEVDGASHNGREHLNQYRDTIFEKLGIKTFRVSSRKTPEQRDLKSASERLHAALRCQPYESSSLPPHIKKALEGMFTFIMGD